MSVLPVALPRRFFAKTRIERVIGVVRVAIAAASLLAVWLDPAEPARIAEITYALHAAYLGYALLLAAVMWRRDSHGALPLVTHIGDILVVSVLQYLTLGPSSPFFFYFMYALIAAALRWGWQGTVRTAALVLLMYVVVGLSIHHTLGPAEFEGDRFIVRAIYLCLVAAALVYLGQHEAWQREEIRQLARWPVAQDGWICDVPRILEHAAGIAGARRVYCAWTMTGETEEHVAAFPPTTAGLPDGVTTWPDAVPFLTDQLSGRVAFLDIPAPSDEVAPLLEVLAREIGASLDHLRTQDRSREFAVAEERIRVARNLHDGVLQALTGIRFQLRRMATRERRAEAPPPVAEHLLAIERALSIEQRELRCFIEDLKPGTRARPAPSSLATRLDDVGRRLALEWRTPISIRVSPNELSAPEACETALPLMVHEAVVNALKHARPTRVSVVVRADDGVMRVIVHDDGAGFPFKGRRDHAELVADHSGPVSLLERAALLGGRVAVESGEDGSFVEVSLPMKVANA